MAGMTENVMTEAGLKKTQDQLDYLIGTKRNEIAKEIEFARGFGDLSENAEYDEAKKKQAQLEEEISRLQNLLRTAKVVSSDEISTTKVTIGSVVTVRDTATKEEFTYTIVGSEEADPWEDLISNESAVGAALMGATKGATVEVSLPNDQTVKYKVVHIGSR